MFKNIVTMEEVLYDIILGAIIENYLGPVT